MKKRFDFSVLLLILTTIALSTLYSALLPEENYNLSQNAFSPLVTNKNLNVAYPAQEKNEQEAEVWIDKSKPINEPELKEILAGKFDFSAFSLNLDTKYVILYDQTNRRVLYAKNTNEKCYPASTTKLLTALVLLELCDLNYIATVGNEIDLIAPDSSISGLKKEMRLSFYDLLQGLLLVSGNDAAYTIAVNVARLTLDDPNLPVDEALSYFSDYMNKMARDLGAVHSFFESPDGYHSDGHYTTAADMLVIADAAINHDIIRNIVLKVNETIRIESGETFEWRNSNALLRDSSSYYYQYAIGLKTGYTDKAGYCLVSVAEKEGVRTIAVLLGAPDNEDRWIDTIKLFDFGFENKYYSETYILQHEEDRIWR